MNRLWTMRGKSKKSGLYETHCVIADCIEYAVERLSATHEEIAFERVEELGSDWN